MSPSTFGSSNKDSTAHVSTFHPAHYPYRSLHQSASIGLGEGDEAQYSSPQEDRLRYSKVSVESFSSSTRDDDQTVEQLALDHKISSSLSAEDATMEQSPPSQDVICPVRMDEICSAEESCFVTVPESEDDVNDVQSAGSESGHSDEIANDLEKSETLACTIGVAVCPSEVMDQPESSIECTTSEPTIERIKSLRLRSKTKVKESATATVSVEGMGSASRIGLNPRKSFAERGKRVPLRDRCHPKGDKVRT